MSGIVVAAGSAAWERDVLRAIDRSESMTLARRCVDAADLLAAARTGTARVAFVAADLPGLDLWIVDELRSAGVRVVAVDADAHRAAAIGIGEVVGAGDVVELDLGSTAPNVPAPTQTGRVWAVWGTAGAPGTSTVALTLAVAAARAGRPTALVDADTRAGSLAQQLAVLDDVSGLMAACRAALRGRADEISSHLLEVEPRLHVLTGLPRADGWQHIRTVAMQRVIDDLAGSHDVVVVDCGSTTDLDGATPTANVLKGADELVVVGRCDPVGLSRLVRAVQMVRESVGAPHHLVVNQVRASLGWRESEVSVTIGRLTGRAPDVFLPWDQDALDRAAINGQAPHEASPRSHFVTRIDALTRRLLAG